MPGGAAATILAGGIGAAFVGVFTTITERNPTMLEVMTLSAEVGPMSGKTTYAVGVWLISWGALYLWWRRRSIALSRSFVRSLVALIMIGILGTFPPTYERVAGLLIQMTTEGGPAEGGPAPLEP